MKQIHEGYVRERQRGVEVKNLSTEKKERRGDRGRIAMSVEKVIESPEDHEERLTRGGKGLEVLELTTQEEEVGGRKSDKWNMQKVRRMEKEKRE